jgi:hypothetical protein
MGEFHRVRDTVRWQYAGALAVLPWVLLVFDDSWIYPLPGTLDAWLYHGFMTNYSRFVELFPSTYYGTRLAWIVPGHFVFAVFPPIIGNLALHIGFYYLAIGATFALLWRLSDQTRAFIGAVMMGTSPPILFAIGSNYVDGPVITYALVALATAAWASTSPLRHRWLLASGAATALMVHSNLVSVMVVPLLPIVLLSLSSSPRPSTRDGFTYMAGAIVATLALGIVSVTVGGGSWAFFMPSIRWALSASAPTPVPGALHFPSVLRYLIPASALFAFVFSAATRRLDRHQIAVGLSLVWLAGTFVVFDFLGGTLLATQYYVSWLVPLSVLVLAVHCFGPRVHLGRIAVWAIAIGFVVSGVIGIQSIEPGIATIGHERTALAATSWVVLAAAFVAATVLCTARRASIAALAVWVPLYATASALAGHSLNLRPDPRAKDLFVAVEQVFQAVRDDGPIKRVLFWYGLTPLTRYFESIAATHLYAYSLVGIHYPTLPADSTGPDRSSSRIQAGTRIALLTPTPDVNESDLHTSFAAHGLDVRVGPVRRIEAPNLRFFLTLLEVVPVPNGNTSAPNSTP